MGKQGKQWGAQAWSSDSAYGYYQWPQDWSYQPPKDHGGTQRRKSDKDNAMPSYEQAVLVEDEPLGSTEGIGAGQEGQHGLSTVQVVQKALNAARKAAGRCKRLQEDIEVRRLKWNKYEADVKKNFLQQHQQFQQDMQRLGKELLTAQQQAADASSKVKDAALQERTTVVAAAVKEEHVDQGPWDRLLDGAEPATRPMQVDDIGMSNQGSLQTQARPSSADAELQAILQLAATGGPQALPPEDRDKLQRWLSQTGCVSGVDFPVQDPWSDFGVQDVALQRALAKSMLPGSRGAAGEPFTPQRGTTSCPRTPVPSAPAPISAKAPVAVSSRMKPFPPPVSSVSSVCTVAQEATSQTSPAPPSFAGTPEDPYLFVGSPAEAPPHSTTQSPAAVPPKHPHKARTSVKDAAKPTGPLHIRSPTAGREDHLEAKRAALTQTALAAAQPTPHAPQVQRFVLKDDDEDLLLAPSLVGQHAGGSTDALD